MEKICPVMITPSIEGEVDWDVVSTWWNFTWRQVSKAFLQLFSR